MPKLSSNLSNVSGSILIVLMIIVSSSSIINSNNNNNNNNNKELPTRNGRNSLNRNESLPDHQTFLNPISSTTTILPKEQQKIPTNYDLDNFGKFGNFKMSSSTELRPIFPLRVMESASKELYEQNSKEVAVCVTVGIIGNPSHNFMSFGINWGTSYDLPNSTWILNHIRGFNKHPVPLSVWQRRSRRSLYEKIEIILNNLGYNGRDCILRTLCESRQYLHGAPKMSMIGEMLKAIFSLPKKRLLSRELTESISIADYDRAYRKAKLIDDDCSRKYICNFSLLDLAFGKYSKPPENYYQHYL